MSDAASLSIRAGHLDPSLCYPLEGTRSLRYDGRLVVPGMLVRRMLDDLHDIVASEFT